MTETCSARPRESSASATAALAAADTVTVPVGAASAGVGALADVVAATCPAWAFVEAAVDTDAFSTVTTAEEAPASGRTRDTTDGAYTVAVAGASPERKPADATGALTEVDADTVPAEADVIPADATVAAFAVADTATEDGEAPRWVDAAKAVELTETCSAGPRESSASAVALFAVAAAETCPAFTVSTVVGLYAVADTPVDGAGAPPAPVVTVASYAVTSAPSPAFIVNTEAWFAVAVADT